MLLNRHQLETEEREGKVWVKDIVRKKWLIMTPEEEVRQQLVHLLIYEKKIAPGRIGVEKGIRYQQMEKRIDVLVFDKQAKPWLLCECKAPSVSLKADTLNQIARYNHSLNAPHLLITNGVQWLCFSVDSSGTYQYVAEGWPMG